MMLIANLVLWVLLSSTSRNYANSDHEMINSPLCNYTAIYNFGDSNSDTGGIFAAFYPPAPPSGETYFGRPAGRASDGRLIIDFVAERVGIAYLSAYLDSIGSNFKQGANFATGGATIQRPNGSWFENGRSPFPLEIQVEHFTQFKDRTTFLYNQGDECFKKKLPKPDNFSKALFTIDIGQNDLGLAQQTHMASIVSLFISQVRGLYYRGARTFWIHNTGPLGCLPIIVVKVHNPTPGFLDENGCVKSQNDVALEFNKELKDAIVGLRRELSDAAIVYVDMYSAKYELISHAKNLGFEDPFEICCGYHGIGYDVSCGNTGNVNGTEVLAGSCANPSKVISWDSVHYSEAANCWIANRILSGSLSDPPIDITRACHKQ